MSISSDLLNKVKYWASSQDFEPWVNEEISELLSDSKTEELTNRFYKDLSFGTGGLRGILGAGTNRMNVYNIRRATSAFASYLKSNQGSAHTPLRVAISYDSRNFSQEFAKTTAEVFAGWGIESFITEELRPVPVLSFMVREFACQGGICITASHNPPEYNGYKVYWQDGGQLVPPHDQKVIEEYNKIESYSDFRFMNYDEAKSSGLISEVSSEVDSRYFTKIQSLMLHPNLERNIRVVYTPLHGSGIACVPEALRRFHFKDVFIVPEQEKPDGKFPTVESPNPEDPASLKIAEDFANDNQGDLILATDPDCDRVAMAVKEGDRWTKFNGNQMGCLLFEYILSSKKEQNLITDLSYVVKTIVTTDLQKDIASSYGCSCYETLTGFKWIADLIGEKELQSKDGASHFICGGEESYGFLAGSFVRDKDGVSTCAMIAEMLCYYKHKGLTLTEVLDDLYRQHGIYQEHLVSIDLAGKAGETKINQIMSSFRSQPPRSLDNRRIDHIRDYKKQEILSLREDGEYLHLKMDESFPLSDVLQFFLADGSKITIRPSGTEAKVKIYFSLRESVSNTKEIPKIKKKMWEKISLLEQEFRKIIA